MQISEFVKFQIVPAETKTETYVDGLIVSQIVAAVRITRDETNGILVMTHLR